MTRPGRCAHSSDPSGQRVRRKQLELAEQGRPSGLAELAYLVSHVARADLEVTLSFEGEQRPLPRTVEVSAYRIVQEALTNTVKHARARTAGVRIRYGCDALQLEVVDDGQGTAPAPRACREATDSWACASGSTFDRDDYVFEALRCGASGFLLKNAPPEELLHAVRVVARGDALLSPSVTRRMIERFAQRGAATGSADDLQRLTDREREVLRHLASGKSNAELAEALYVGEGTVKTHVSSVLSKLGLRDRVQAVVFAYESGLVTPGM